MYILNKELIENKKNIEKAQSLKWNLTIELRNGVANEFKTIVSSYFLYKVCTQNSTDEISYADVINNALNVSGEVLLYFKDSISENEWNRIYQYTKKYSWMDFALVPFLPSECVGKVHSEFSTPSSIVRLAQEILSCKAKDKVIDIGSGIGDFLMSTALNVENAEYYGCDINIEARLVSIIRAELIGKKMNLRIGDSLSILNTPEYVGQFDKVFVNYPFMLKLNRLSGSNQYLDYVKSKATNVERVTTADWPINLLAFDLLNEYGKAVCLMANGNTYNLIDVEIRKYFIKNRMIESVIALPSNLFEITTIPATLIVLNKNNKNKSIRMVDASNIYHGARRKNELNSEDIQKIMKALDEDNEYSRCVDLIEFEKNEYKLSPSTYFTKQYFYDNGVDFESIIKSITRGAPLSANQLDEMTSNEETNMQYLMLANIKNGIVDEKLPYLSLIEKKLEKYCIKNNNLIISKNGYPYKIAVVNVKKGQQILANGNLFVIEIDETKANPYYVKAFLESENGIGALKAITSNATIPTINLTNLVKLQIPLPSLEEQEKIVQKYMIALDEVQINKLRLKKSLDHLQHVFDEESENSLC